MSSPQRPTNYRDIALKAGVSVASVSLALRNDRRISQPVREKIKRLAKEMGYRPNPLLSAYQASVRSNRPAQFQATLGWFNDHPDQQSWSLPWHRLILKGAKERAQELGYEVDEVWIPEIKVDDPMGNVRKIQKILRARGICGVILPNLQRSHHGVLDWEGFTVVCIGQYHLNMETTTVPTKKIHQHHRVSPDFLFNIHLAFQKLGESGRERIGLAISIFTEHETDQAYSAGFLRAQFDLPKSRRVPILFSTEPRDVEAWARKHRPDAVICSHPDVRTGIEKAGLRVPQDTRLAHMTIAPDVAEWSGIDPRHPLLGSAAVDMLTAHLIRNETGAPPYAKAMKVEGVWVEGQT